MSVVVPLALALFIASGVVRADPPPPGVAYTSFASDRAYCVSCFNASSAGADISWALCNTTCDTPGVTSVQLTCTIDCAAGSVIGIEGMFNCSAMSNKTLTNVPCLSSTTTVVTTSKVAPMTTAAPADTSTVTIIIVVVVVVCVLVLVMVVVAAMVRSSNSKSKTVSNVTVVVENKTIESSEPKPKKKKKKTTEAAMGIPDDGYPAEAGGTTSINYPAEAGGSVASTEYAKNASDYASEAGYSSNRGVPPQAGAESSDDSGPPD